MGATPCVFKFCDARAWNVLLDGRGDYLSARMARIKTWARIFVNNFLISCQLRFKEYGDGIDRSSWAIAKTLAKL